MKRKCSRSGEEHMTSRRRFRVETEKSGGKVFRMTKQNLWRGAHQFPEDDWAKHWIGGARG